MHCQPIPWEDVGRKKQHQRGKNQKKISHPAAFSGERTDQCINKQEHQNRTGSQLHSVRNNRGFRTIYILEKGKILCWIDTLSLDQFYFMLNRFTDLRGNIKIIVHEWCQKIQVQQHRKDNSTNQRQQRLFLKRFPNQEKAQQNQHKTNHNQGQDM